MNKKRLINIWKDPVGSQVISVGIVGFLTLLYNLISSLISKNNFYTEFKLFWTLKFELWIYTIILLFLLIVIWIAKAAKKKKAYIYDAETLKLDKALFSKIRNEILPQDVIVLIKDLGFSGGSFHSDLLYKVLEISKEQKKSDFIFFNPALENSKNQLVQEVEKLHEITSQYIFGMGENTLGVPREWIHEQPERFKEANENICEQESRLLQCYDNFIRLGKTTLKV
ncbi:hypothetical protein QEG73_03710 [Chitinophagaceae bacterium 26-R-25]|nr:hypothetical protein [Chitinophagaceae bacterium 26-R-25]